MKWYTVKDRWLDPQMLCPPVIIRRLRRDFMHADRVWLSEDKRHIRFESHLGCNSKHIELNLPKKKETKQP